MEIHLMLLSILIPTYKRSNYLKRNIDQLIAYILRNKLQQEVSLVISNNCSPDDTKDVLDSLVVEHGLTVKIFHQAENIGSVNNVIFLLDQANTDYHMFLGDDDFIEESYLLLVLKAIKEQILELIVPSYRAVSPQGKPLDFGRDAELVSQRYPGGFASCLEHSWRGHQLSGLVFRTQGLADVRRKYDISNMYLFIFLVGYAALMGNSLHLTEYPVQVTRQEQSEKGWSYGEDGLIQDIFDNYKKLPLLTKKQRFLLELKILDEQYWRYAMYLKLGIKQFFKVIQKIITGLNTSTLMRASFLFLLPCLIIKRLLKLGVSGDLMKTLNRPVDI